MKNKYNILILTIYLCSINTIKAQIQTDTRAYMQNKVEFEYKSLILPAANITYGLISLADKKVRTLDKNIYNSINKSSFSNTNLDDYTQILPVAAVYGLNAFGVKGKNNIKDRTIILAVSTAIMGSTITISKRAFGRKRPTGNSHLSFPSGHTATAFMAAEFLHQEYGEVSPMYSIAGYLLATTTGVLRMYNNKHWLSDVVTGAGVGILSTKIAYWINPFIRKYLYKETNGMVSSLTPSYNGEQYMLSFNIKF